CAAAPACSCNVAVPVMSPSWPVIVSSPAVVELVIVAEYVPSPWSVVGPKVTSPLVLNVTVSPTTGSENVSVTVAVAIDVATPSAVIVSGDRVTDRCAAVPTNVYSSLADVADVPNGVVTVMSTVPASSAGETAVITWSGVIA